MIPVFFCEMTEDWLDILEIVCVILGSILSHYAQTDLLFEYEKDIQSLQEMSRTWTELCVCTALNLFLSLSFSEWPLVFRHHCSWDGRRSPSWVKKYTYIYTHCWLILFVCTVCTVYLHSVSVPCSFFFHSHPPPSLSLSLWLSTSLYLSGYLSF